MEVNGARIESFLRPNLDVALDFESP